MNIWRINCKPGKQILPPKEQFKFWLEKGFEGIGYSSGEGFDKNFEQPLESDYLAKEVKNFIYNKIRNEGRQTVRFSTDSNIFVDRMQIGDYIWVRCENIYKLGKISSNGLYNLRLEKYDDDRQIEFYRLVEYLDKEFHESEVPGKIIAS